MNQNPKKVTKIDFGDFGIDEEDTAQEVEVDPKAAALRRSGVRIPITEKEMKALKEAANIPDTNVDESDEDEPLIIGWGGCLVPPMDEDYEDDEEEIAYPFGTGYPC